MSRSVCTHLTDSVYCKQVSQKNILSTYEGSEVLLEFVVAANVSTATAMKSLIDAQLSTAADADSHLSTVSARRRLHCCRHTCGRGRVAAKALDGGNNRYHRWHRSGSPPRGIPSVEVFAGQGESRGTADAFCSGKRFGGSGQRRA